MYNADGCCGGNHHHYYHHLCVSLLVLAWVGLLFFNPAYTTLGAAFYHPLSDLLGSHKPFLCTWFSSEAIC